MEYSGDLRASDLSVGWRASAARSTVRTSPATSSVNQGRAGRVCRLRDPHCSGPRKRAGAVRNPPGFTETPELSTRQVSRGASRVSREIMEKVCLYPEKTMKNLVERLWLFE